MEALQGQSVCCSSASWSPPQSPGLGRTPWSPLSFGQAHTSPPSPSEPTTVLSMLGRPLRPQSFPVLPMCLRHDREETQTGCAQVDPASSPSPLASVIAAHPHCSSVPSDLSSSWSLGSLPYRFTLIASLLRLTRACQACIPSAHSDRLVAPSAPKSLVWTGLGVGQR